MRVTFDRGVCLSFFLELYQGAQTSDVYFSSVFVRAESSARTTTRPRCCATRAETGNESEIQHGVGH